MEQNMTIRKEILWQNPDGRYAEIERNVPPPEGQGVIEGWSSDIVTIYDSNGNIADRYWRSRAPSVR